MSAQVTDVQPVHAPVLGARRADGALVPLYLRTEICETEDTIRANLAACLSRPYKRFNELLHKSAGRTVSIIGSAPSLTKEFHAITGDVIACNASHDFLLKQGKKPDYAMVFDANEVMKLLISPHTGVKYLFASRCHPVLFERFKHWDVTVWHAGGDECLDEMLTERNIQEPIINGGSAAVVRAMFLAYAMGYRDMHLFGVDSSFDNGRSHFREHVVPEYGMEVFCLGKWFETTSWMASQAEDFKIIAPALRAVGANIVIHGDGLIPHIARETGFEVLTT